MSNITQRPPPHKGGIGRRVISKSLDATATAIQRLRDLLRAKQRWQFMLDTPGWILAVFLPVAFWGGLPAAVVVAWTGSTQAGGDWYFPGTGLAVLAGIILYAGLKGWIGILRTILVFLVSTGVVGVLVTYLQEASPREALIPILGGLVIALGMVPTCTSLVLRGVAAQIKEKEIAGMLVGLGMLLAFLAGLLLTAVFFPRPSLGIETQLAVISWIACGLWLLFE